MAELGGAPLVLFFMLLVNTTAARVVTGLNRPRTAFKQAGWIFLLMAVCFGYGTLRINRLDNAAGHADTEEFLSVTTIQPMIPMNGTRGIQT